jgi:hypothetical protein
MLFSATEGLMQQNLVINISAIADTVGRIKGQFFKINFEIKRFQRKWINNSVLNNAKLKLSWVLIYRSDLNKKSSD